MEKRINSKHRIYLQTFKDNIKEFVSKTECDNKSQNQILQFIYDYQPLHFDKCDFVYNPGFSDVSKGKYALRDLKTLKIS